MKRIKDILSVLYIIGIFLLRPSFWGETYTKLGLIILSVFIGLYLLFKVKIDSKINRSTRVIFILIFLLWTYLLIIGFLIQTSGQNFLITSFITNCIAMIATFLAISNKNIKNRVLGTIFLVMILLSASYIVTFILSIFIPYENMFLMKLHSKTYENSGYIYFPFTILYGFMRSGGLVIPRFSSVLREAGMVPMIHIWLLANIRYTKYNNKLFKIIILLGLLGANSTTGYITLSVYIVVKYFIKGDIRLWILKVGMVILSMFLGVNILFNAPYVGINAKLITHSGSIYDRGNIIKESINYIIENPLGVGLYGLTDSGNVGGINLIAATKQIGIIGFILISLIFLIPIFLTKNRNQFFSTNICIYIVMLFSQPLVDSPLIYILIIIGTSYLSYKNDYKNEMNIEC